MNAKVNFSTHSEFLAARVGLSQTITVGRAANKEDDSKIYDRSEIKSLAALESIFLSCSKPVSSSIK
ncbi:hypothetical protein [Sessilibacter sp. MAH2]